MSSYITGFANTAAEWAAWANNKVETAPVVGRVWSTGRDWVVLPGAALVSKVWTTVQPYGSRAVNFTLANKGITTALGLTVVAAIAFRKFGPDLHLKDRFSLIWAQRAAAHQQSELAKLKTAAFGADEVPADLDQEAEKRKQAANGKAANSAEVKAYQAILAYQAGVTKLTRLNQAVTDLKARINPNP